MAEVLIPLEPEKYYHIYNHAVGNENFFEADADYLFFLQKLNKYIIPIADVFAYCLLPNHFHFIVQIKSNKALHQLTNKKSAEELTSKAFANLFNSYAKWYNFTKGRKGTLFSRAFRRKHISNDNYLRTLIIYIHQNPVKAKFTDSPHQWKYSSYNGILSTTTTMLKREQVLGLFDDKINFIFCNTKSVALDDLD